MPSCFFSAVGEKSIKYKKNVFGVVCDNATPAGRGSILKSATHCHTGTRPFTAACPEYGKPGVGMMSVSGVGSVSCLVRFVDCPPKNTIRPKKKRTSHHWPWKCPLVTNLNSIESKLTCNVPRKTELYPNRMDVPNKSIRFGFFPCQIRETPQIRGTVGSIIFVVS